MTTGPRVVDVLDDALSRGDGCPSLDKETGPEAGRCVRLWGLLGPGGILLSLACIQVSSSLTCLGRLRHVCRGSVEV